MVMKIQAALLWVVTLR